MSWANYDDVVRQIEGCGLVLDKPLTFDARIQRWKVDGEDNERRGWTRLKEWTSKAGNTYIVGTFGVWHGTDDGRIKVEINGEKNPLSREDLAAMREAHREAERRLKEERKLEAKTAAAWAASVWAGCDPCTEHDYLTRKGIQAHGLRVLATTERITLAGLDDSNHYRLKCAVGALVVPMHDQHGNVNGIQFIYPRGHARAKKLERDKEFWPSGMAMGGSFGVIGPIRRDSILLVAEGYATAATLFEASGQSVAYAFSANNLAKAGKILRKQNPRLRLLFAADDDYLTEGNPGCSHAAQATAEIEKTAWFKPDFTDETGADRRGGKKLTDFNDLFALAGSALPISAQVNAKLDELKWRDAGGGGGRLTPPSGGNPPSEGGGEDDKRPNARSVMSIDDLVARFMPLDDGTGKYLFDSWTNKVAHRDQMSALLPAGMRADEMKRHPVWVERGAFYLDQVGFDPSGRDKTVKLNTWRGWPMAPKEGKCERLLELLAYLCGGEGKTEIYEWVLRWMAYPLQHPGAKMNSAIIMHGPQGTGKSAVFQTYAKIYGDYSTVLNQRGIEDRFNADWADSKLFILAEEVVTRAEMWHIKNELKELVTGEWIRINPKNIAAYRQRNQVNIVYLSNENQPLPIENDDRRHLVVWTPQNLSEAYYDEVFLEIEAGGTEALYHHLLNLDLKDFHPKKRPPMTEAKQALIDISLPSEIRFINDWTGGDTPWPVVPCLASDLYAAYLKWCRLNGESRPRPSNQFHGAVARRAGWTKKKQRVFPNCHCTGQTVPKNMVIPPDAILQAVGTVKPPADGQAEWLTGCIHQFTESMSEEQKWAA